jgi:hypothetical protein
MAFSPVVPFGGLAGLRFLDRTHDAQFGAFSRSPDIQREIDYFLENAGKADTAAALVSDRRLLAVALGAFGLDAEIGKRAFIRNILDDGTIDPRALANRLADPAWAEFSRTLGHGDVGSLLVFRHVREEIVGRFRERQFEQAVGNVDVDLRLALNFRRRIQEIAASPQAGISGWFKIMGSEPMRRVVEGAYGLPDSFGQIDIDRQREELEARTERMFGDSSPAVFASAENVEALIRRFLVTAQVRTGPSAGTPGLAALSMLQASAIGPAASANLFASNF